MYLNFHRIYVIVVVVDCVCDVCVCVCVGSRAYMKVILQSVFKFHKYYLLIDQRSDQTRGGSS